MEMKRKSTRKTLIEENLLALKDKVPVSDRNINIVEDYVNGMILEEIGKKYNISIVRARAIAVNYIAHCHKYLGKLYEE